MEIPEIKMQPFTSVWNNLPQAIQAVQPKPFEAYDQNQGFMVYKTTLIGHKSGKLKVTEIHDYATVFLKGKYIGKLDRHEGMATIELPKTEVKNPVLEILAEGMGHINFAQELIKRKGITERISLNGITLMNWEIYKLPIYKAFISGLKPSGMNAEKPVRNFRNISNHRCSAK